MDEHAAHHKIMGLPPVAWIGFGGLVLLFVYSHRQASASGVPLAGAASTDLAQTGSEAAALQVNLQQEQLAAKTAQDQFSLAAAQQGLAQSQQAFQANLYGVQQQQQAQGQANQLALQGGRQALSQNETQFQEAQKFEQQAYRNGHSGGFTLGTFLAGVTQLGDSAINAYKSLFGSGSAQPAPGPIPRGAPSAAPGGIPPGGLTIAPYVSPIG